MGYRSDVLYAAQFENNDAYNAFLMVLNLKYIHSVEHGHLFNNIQGSGICGDMYTEQTNNLIWYTVDDVKWYDGYENVQMVNRVFQLAWSMGAATKFIRIGEETGDVEVDYNESNSQFEHHLDDYFDLTNPSLSIYANGTNYGEQQ